MFPLQHHHVSPIPQPKPMKSKPKQVAKFVGVRQRQSGRWVAEIKGTSKTTQKIRMWLGTFKTAEEAARAYDEAACLLRGSNTRTNFPNTTTTLSASDSPLASRIRSLLDRPKQKDQTQMNNKPISRTLPLSDQAVDPIFPKEVLVEPSDGGQELEYSFPNHVPMAVAAEISATLAMNRQGSGLEELFYGEDCNSSSVDLHELTSFQHLFCNT